MRKEYSEIVELAEKNHCNQIFSWSKYKTFLDDTYTYYLNRGNILEPVLHAL